MLRKVSRAIALTVVALAAAVIAMAVVVPRMAGATPYTVLTGSMQPTYPPGTLVVVRPVDPSEIRVGDVVTYQPRSADPMVITHRVVRATVNARGVYRFRTRGDANNVDDAGWVRPIQIRGRLWYAVPYLGWLSNLMSGVGDHSLLALIAMGLLVYAGSTLIGSRGGRRRAVPRPELEPPSTPSTPPTTATPSAAPSPPVLPSATGTPGLVAAGARREQPATTDLAWRSPFCQAPVWDPRHALVRDH